MLNIGPPTDGHAAVMYEGGGAYTPSRVSHCRGSYAMLRGPRAIRSTRVSNVFALILRCVACVLLQT